MPAPTTLSSHFRLSCVVERHGALRVKHWLLAAGMAGLALAVTNAVQAANLDPAAPLPEDAENAAAVWADGRFLVFGGRAEGQPLDSIVAYDPVHDTMETLPHNLPVPLSDLAAVHDGAGDVYLFGGHTGKALGRSDLVLRYHVPTGAVETLATMPFADAGLSAVWTGSEVILFPGIGCVASCNVLHFDPGTGTFTPSQEVLQERVWRAGAFWNGTHAFLIGGKHPSTGALSAAIDRYDPSVKVLERMDAKLAQPRADAPVLWDGTIAYVAGGQTASGSASTILTFRPSTEETGTYLRTLPAPARGLSGAWGPTGFLFGADGPGGAGDRTLCFGCAPPVAAFSCSPSSAIARVAFEDLSSPTGFRPIVLREWDLGDGTVLARTDAAPLEHDYAAPGEQVVTLRVTDSAGLQRVAEAVCHAPPDRPPVIEDIGPVSVSDCNGLRLRLRAQDPEGVPLTYTADGLPSGARLDGDVFTWAPSKDHHGDHKLRFGVSDGLHQVSTTVQVRVVECGVAQVPEPVDEEEEPDKDRQDSTGTVDGDGGPCGVLPVRWPTAVTALPQDDGVEVGWTFEAACSVDRFLVWNGTGETLLAVVPADDGPHYATWVRSPEEGPHRYWVQAQPEGLADRFDAMRAAASGYVLPPECDCDTPEMGQEVLPASVPTAPGPPPAAIAAAAAVLLGAAGLTAWIRMRGRGAVGLLLFTRLKRDKLLDHPSRAQIMEQVQERPGIHYNEVVRMLGTGNGAAEHHLKVLLDARLIKERTTDGYRCFFPAHYYDNKAMDATITLRAGLARDIAAALVEAPGATIGELAAATGAPTRTVSYHIQRFRKVGLVEVRRRGRAYAVFPSGIATSVVHREPPVIETTG